MPKKTNTNPPNPKPPAPQYTNISDNISTQDNYLVYYFIYYQIIMHKK